MSRNSDNLTAAALLTVGLLGAGVAAFKVYQDRNDTHAGNVAAGQAQAPTGSSPATGGSPWAGSGVPSTADLIRQQQEQQAAMIRQQQITQLRRDLARVQNDMDVQVTLANSIKNRAVDPAFRSTVTDRVWADCRNSGAWLTQAARCNNGNMTPKADAAVRDEWAARLALELQPVQAQLSRLNAEQLAIVDNLRGLGVTLQAAEVKKVNL